MTIHQFFLMCSGIYLLLSIGSFEMMERAYLKSDAIMFNGLFFFSIFGFLFMAGAKV